MDLQEDNPSNGAEFPLFNKILTVSFFIVFFGFVYTLYNDYTNPEVCLSSIKVVSITSVENHKVNVILEDARTVALDPPSVKPGQNYCTVRARKKDKTDIKT